MIVIRSGKEEREGEGEEPRQEINALVTGSLMWHNTIAGLALSLIPGNYDTGNCNTSLHKYIMIKEKKDRF